MKHALFFLVCLSLLIVLLGLIIGYLAYA